MNYNESQSYQDEYYDEGNGESASQELDLQDYLRTLRKHKWPIVLFTAAVTGLAAYYAVTATPIYRATATLLIEEQKANVVSIEELYGIDTENADYYETQFQLLRSRALAQRVVEQMKLWEHPEFSASSPEGSLQRGDATEQSAGEAQATADSSIARRISSVLESIGIGSETATPDAVNGVVEDQTVPVGLESFATSDWLVDAASEAPDGQIPLTAEQERVVGMFMSRLSISPVRKTKLVNIGFESADPVLAARITNVVGEQYIQSFLDAKLELTTTASEWLNERLGALKSDLDEAEGRLIAFQQENDLVDVQGSVGRLNEQQLLLDNQELTLARSALAAARDVFNDVQELRQTPELLETVPAVQADPLVQRTKIEQGTVQRELDELSNRYGERHPRVQDVKAELASLEGALQGHINRVAGTIAKDYQLAQQRVATINAKLVSGRSEIQSIGNKKFELDALQREVDTKRGIYDQYFSRMTEARSADGLETANARISDFARVPVSPVKPNKQMIVALAALASLVLSMLMAFLYELMDDTVKSTNDIEVKLGMKLLGLLPLVKGGVFGRKVSLPLDPNSIPDKNGTFAEAVSTVRTALTLDDGDEPRKVILVTSSVPGEGKSTSAINIACSLAQLERVLLIDCDLRRPTLAKAAELDRNAPGLSNLIAQTASAHACIQRGVFGGKVDMLPSGPIPDQPLELLSSKRFERILQELGHFYDRVVIDCAPTQAVSDALVLSQISDAVIYIVKSHDTTIDLVRRGLSRLQQASAPIAGVLVTQVDIDKITSYGGDYYYQGYYDYYGYSEHGQSGKRSTKIKLTQEELIAIRNDEGGVNLGLESMYGQDRRPMRAQGERDDQPEVQRRSRDDRLPERRSVPASVGGGGSRARLDRDLDFL